MTSMCENGGAERVIVIVRGVDEYHLTMWDDARTSDPERMDWARPVTRKANSAGGYDVALSVNGECFADLMTGVTDDISIEECITSTLYELASEIEENDFYRSEIEAVPLVAGRAAEPGADARLVDWTHYQVASICWVIDQSKGVARDVAMTRVSTDRYTSKVLVSLPAEIEREALRIHRTQVKTKTMEDAVFEAIQASYSAEPKQVREWDHDEIPY